VRDVEIAAGPLLRTRALVKRFGGLVATDELDLEVRRGELHALIGPNGAGKTTLIAQLTGELAPTSGSIEFDGADITRMATHLRARAGLARSYQVTSVFLGFSAFENVALAAQARAGSSFRFWNDVRRDTGINDAARKVLKAVGLEGREDVLAGALAHGERRQLEIGLALASRPRMLLLDEPLAGLGHEEAAGVIDLMRGLKASETILMVEHDMNAVFALADRITVLVGGCAIASGTPDEIRNDAEVRRAYLGES
jgi:branched-chain amino acid transport system ATP-binding protein